MAQNLVVGLIVIAAALYVGWRYLPKGWLQRLGVKPAPGCGGDDGGCSSCGSCGSGQQPPEEKTVAMPRSRQQSN
ncbi:MAG: hypothetical protein QM569_14680 [Acidovorax sp.]|uniref:hypothetical protein n=1 Tax=Acidovorax sp. TaxID=1872122 RepID=UPI0039E695CA